MEATTIRVGNRPRDKNDNKSSGGPSPSKEATGYCDPDKNIIENSGQGLNGGTQRFVKLGPSLLGN